VLEALGRWDEAIADYRAVLAAAPNDPAGWRVAAPSCCPRRRRPPAAAAVSQLALEP